MSRGSVVQRFWEKVVITEAGCWQWVGATVKGYGNLTAGGRSDGRIYAHRVSWLIHYGDIPVGKHVLHSCDNPPCCNPDHLFLGTPKDNGQDMARKGRSGAPKGDQCMRRKLSEADVVGIVTLYRTGAFSKKELAVRFKVDPSHISVLTRGLTWRHLWKDGKL